jgi:hypothetical protein
MASQAARITPGARAPSAPSWRSASRADGRAMNSVSVISESHVPVHPFNPPMSFPAGAFVERHRAPPPERTHPDWAPITTVLTAAADALASILAPLNRPRSRVDSSGAKGEFLYRILGECGANANIPPGAALSSSRIRDSVRAVPPNTVDTFDSRDCSTGGNPCDLDRSNAAQPVDLPDAQADAQTPTAPARVSPARRPQPKQ